MPSAAAHASTSAPSLSKFNISSEDPKAVTAFLQEASEHYHLVSPASSVAMIPEGCSVVTSVVLIDDKETYPATKADDNASEHSKRCLGKIALDRISGAAGIVWDPVFSCRIDNGFDPLYCQWRAVGTYRGFDGSPITIPKNKTVDLRQGSPQAKAMSDKQLPQASQFVMEQAESKAMNRVVRTLGVRTSYTREELKKPFIVARLMMTGANIKDPALRREIILMRAASMLGGGATLYGGGQPLQMSQGTHPPTGAYRIEGSPRAPALGQGTPPPPVGTTPEDEDEDGPISPTPGQRVVAFGSNKGRSIDQLSDSDLAWYAGACEKSINDPARAKFKASNQKVLDDCRAEQAMRVAEDQAEGREPGDDDFPT